MAHAAQWLKLNENSLSILMLDKQSVITQDAYKKAWVKVDYKRLQTNTESVEKEYNSAKALWFFDCAKQKSATTQVFQYLNQELVYSAGVEVKSAEFIEPLPDSDLEIAMRYVCKPEKAKPAKNPTPTQPSPAQTAPPETSAAPQKTPTNTEQPPAQPPPAEMAKDKAKSSEAKPANPNGATTLNTKTIPNKTASGKSNASLSAWSYDEKTGPDQWGKLNPDFQMCDAGRNQSPVNIQGTIHAALKPIRAIRKFAANDIVLGQHAIEVNFKKGNMMVIDSQPFQLKQLVLRMPSEHKIAGKPFPLEAQWHHEDSAGNTVMVSVLYKEDKKANTAFDKLLAQLPKDNKPVKITSRITPDEMIPKDNRYYRYTGSLTTPPCTEGLRWVVMKTPQAIGAAQLETLFSAMLGNNARPIQPLHGRVILE